MSCGLCKVKFDLGDIVGQVEFYLRAQDSNAPPERIAMFPDLEIRIEITGHRECIIRAIEGKEKGHG